MENFKMDFNSKKSVNKVNFKNKTLALFFTRGISLYTWYRIGIFSREIIIYKEFSDYFDKIYLFTYGDKNDLRFKKILPENIIIIPKPFAINDILYSFLIPFIHWSKLKRIDYYKSNQIDGSWSALISKILFNKFFVNRSGFILSKFEMQHKSQLLKYLIIKLIEKFTFRFSDQIIITSQQDLAYITKKLKIKNKKINIIPNYVDINNFRKLNIKKLRNSIVYVGRFTSEKNLFSVIDAISNTKYSFYLIGEGNLKNKLKKFARIKNSAIFFEGIVSNKDLPLYLNKFEIFILPSYHEGMPKSLIEAMACELPVIGTKNEGICEIISNRINGLLTDFDAESIKENISILNENGELRDELGKNARTYIEDNYSVRKILDKELKIYKRLL
jgi:glycosyltransferase involved in cell wall biosynthesis